MYKELVNTVDPEVNIFEVLLISMRQTLLEFVVLISLLLLVGR